MQTPAHHLSAALRFAKRTLPPNTSHIPGRTLTLYREAAAVPAGEVAARLDVSKQRVSAIEKEGCSPTSPSGSGPPWTKCPPSGSHERLRPRR